MAGLHQPLSQRGGAHQRLPHDTNNATDGDLYTAWALLRAAERWDVPEFRARAERIGRDLLRCCVVESQGRQLLLPGAAGFREPEGVIINLSYHAFGALLPAISGLAGYLLRPEIQSQGFGRGLLPGAAAELSVAADGMLSPFERAAWDTLLPPLTAESIAGAPLVPPLSPDRLAYMMLRWDQQIGARFRPPR